MRMEVMRMKMNHPVNDCQIPIPSACASHLGLALYCTLYSHVHSADLVVYDKIMKSLISFIITTTLTIVNPVSPSHLGPRPGASDPALRSLIPASLGKTYRPFYQHE